MLVSRRQESTHGTSLLSSQQSSDLREAHPTHTTIDDGQEVSTLHPPPSLGCTAAERCTHTNTTSYTPTYREPSQPAWIVYLGRSPGVYKSWSECQKQTDGFKGNCYLKVASEAQARDDFAEYTKACTAKYVAFTESEVEPELYNCTFSLCPLQVGTSGEVTKFGAAGNACGFCQRLVNRHWTNTEYDSESYPTPHYLTCACDGDPALCGSPTDIPKPLIGSVHTKSTTASFLRAASLRAGKTQHENTLAELADVQSSIEEQELAEHLRKEHGSVSQAQPDEVREAGGGESNFTLNSSSDESDLAEVETVKSVAVASPSVVQSKAESLFEVLASSSAFDNVGATARNTNTVAAQHITEANPLKRTSSKKRKRTREAKQADQGRKGRESASAVATHRSDKPRKSQLNRRAKQTARKPCGPTSSLSQKGKQR